MSEYEFLKDYWRMVLKSASFSFCRKLSNALSNIQVLFGGDIHKKICLMIMDRFPTVNLNSIVVSYGFRKLDYENEMGNINFKKKILKEIREWFDTEMWLSGCRLFIVCVCYENEIKSNEIVAFIGKALECLFLVTTGGWFGEPEIVLLVADNSVGREMGYEILALGERI